MRFILLFTSISVAGRAQTGHGAQPLPAVFAQKKPQAHAPFALEDLPSPKPHTDWQVFWLPDSPTDRTFPVRLRKFSMTNQWTLNPDV
jgi:hypothetical protein